MKVFDETLLRQIVYEQRRKLALTQEETARRAGMNRIMLGRIERGTYIPTILQLQALSEVLQYDPTSLWREK